MEKIKRVSFFFRIIFQIIFIFIPLVLIVGWVNAPEPLTFLKGTINLNMIPRTYTEYGLHGSAILHELNNVERLLGFCVALIPLTIALFILYALIKLFRLYEQGEIFSINNVRYIRNIGYALLIGQLLHPLYEFLMGVVLTWRNPPGFRFFAVTLDQTNIGIVLTSILVILISWIMAEGCHLREEQQYTI